MSKYTFRELVSDSRTGLNPRKNFSLGQGDNFYITIKDIHNGKIVITDKTDRVDDAAIEIIKKRSRIKNGDILFASIGRIGETAIVTDKNDTWDVNESVFIFTLNTDVITQKFFCSLFQSQNIQEKLNRDSSGSTFKSIKMNQLEKMIFDIPSIEEQKQITSKLDKVSAIIEDRKQQIEKLDLLVKSRFIELFGDSVTNSMGWDTDTVIGVCNDIYGGGTPSKSHPEYYENGDIPWVSSKDMKTDVLYDSQIKINQLGVDNSAAKMVPVNSVIMVIRSGILKHTLPVAINAVPITVNQDLKVFIPSKRILSTFLMYQFKMLEKDILSGVRAVTADNIEFDSLKKREIIVPPIELQNQFAALVEQTDKSKLKIQKSLEKLETLKKALMQKYFG